ncbi:TrmB family transcriptional regulator [Patescibacteria group bacterium]
MLSEIITFSIKHMLVDELEGIGLNENEAKAYLALLELSEASVAQIALKAKLKRPTTYLIVESLKEKGLVGMVKREKKTLFLAKDPRKIVEMLEERKEKINRVMPQLLSITNVIDKKPEIRFFEGQEGIKEVYRDTLNYPNQEMLAFFSDSYVEFLDEDFVQNYYFPKRVEKKIWARAILPDQEAIRKLVTDDVAHLRQTKIVPKNTYDINIEINIYGKSKVAIISFEEQFGLIIESKKIHESLRNIFNLVWDLLPETKLEKK